MGDVKANIANLELQLQDLKRKEQIKNQSDLNRLKRKRKNITTTNR